MPTQTKLYDPQSVIVTFGPNTIKGFAKDSMVEAERNVDSFTTVVGVDGEGTRTRSANKSGKVTIKLMKTSSSNAVLSAISQAHELSPAGLGVLPLMIKDGLGNSLCFAAEAWVVKPPKVDYGAEVAERDWVFETASLNIIEAGN